MQLMMLVNLQLASVILSKAIAFLLRKVKKIEGRSTFFLKIHIAKATVQRNRQNGLEGKKT